MDPDVEQLVREQRLLAAAELAAGRGDAQTASILFERACDFGRAALEALKARDFARALPLSLEAKDEETAAQAARELASDPPRAERTAYRLEQRGDHAWAARLLERIGKNTDAARAFERAGLALDAARLLEQAGEVVAAARALEAQLRREPGRAALNVALGGLLFRYGKTDAAVRALQKVPESAPERRAALSILVPALDRLGLGEARTIAGRELDSLGGPLAPRDEESRPQVPVRARLFGRYEMIREVASSPSARVLECFDGVRAEKVAVKIFAGYDARGAGRDALARFEREVRALRALDHPNIVPMRDYLAEGPALILAWMTRGTLEAMLAREPLAPARAVEIAEAVLGALGEAHRLGIIHRDVKPANVLFDDAGVTRLGDFGVAHLSDLSATATAGIIGTHGYMSPEQRAGHPATVRSDLYAVGAILWEMLTGEKPDVVEATLRTRPSGVHRDLDARHDDVVLSLLAADPAARPDGAFAARRALGGLAWPHTIELAGPRPEGGPKSVHPAAGRLTPIGPSTYRDEWLDRTVVCVPLSPATLARASEFARAEHPALQTVLRVDREGGAVWLARIAGERLAGRLGEADAAAVRDALARLHELGVVHGSVDRDHVFVDEVQGVTLAFAESKGPLATPDLDRIGLARLC